MENLKVSIITPVFNNKKTIESCIKSVLSQTYNNIEHIIIDGKSTDGTMEIINKYKDQIYKIVSEKDHGIYDAFNKGISLATGEIIGILNSDDFFFDENTIEEIAQKFCSKNIDLLYANMEIISNKNNQKIIRYWKGGNFSLNRLHYGWMPPHPTCYVRSTIYDKYGVYSKYYSISGDYEFLIRILKNEDLNIHYLDKTTIKMRHGGKSTKNIFNSIKKKIEDYKIIKAHSLKGKIFTLIWKSLSKIPQLISKP